MCPIIISTVVILLKSPDTIYGRGGGRDLSLEITTQSSSRRLPGRPTDSLYVEEGVSSPCQLNLNVLFESFGGKDKSKSHQV